MLVEIDVSEYTWIAQNGLIYTAVSSYNEWAQGVNNGTIQLDSGTVDTMWGTLSGIYQQAEVARDAAQILVDQAGLDPDAAVQFDLLMTSCDMAQRALTEARV